MLIGMETTSTCRSVPPKADADSMPQRSILRPAARATACHDYNVMIIHIIMIMIAIRMLSWVPGAAKVLL